MEEQSPETPPAVIPSPEEDEQDDEDEETKHHLEENASSQGGAQSMEVAAAATPPRSEMLNLPRDFLSLRPQQEPELKHLQQLQQLQRGAGVIPKPENDLLQVSTTPPVAQKCSTPGSGVYPRALASHEEVLRDKDLFLDTLRRLHGSLGFKSLTIPTIGGTQLDLHLLYKEVTARGGLQQVIKDRIWKEIKAAFHFPPTTTNASFVLRKYYSSLLHHYEQVYFFRNQGTVVSAPGDNSGAGELFSDDSDAIKRRRKRSYEPAEPETAGATECIGQTVTGSIVGKFEHGYLVSVSVGNESLKGVLYSVPPGEYVPQFSTSSKLPNGTSTTTTPSLSEAVNPDGEIRHKRRRRLGLRKKDPNAPKLNRSAYNFFFAEQRARIRLLQPNREISRMIGDSWSKLTDEQRVPYKQRGLVDKERYRTEIKQYRERMNPQKGGSKENSQMESDLVNQGGGEEDDDASDDQREVHVQKMEQEVNGKGDENGEKLQVEHQQQQQETLEFKSILAAAATQAA